MNNFLHKMFNTYAGPLQIDEDGLYHFDEPYFIYSYRLWNAYKFKGGSRLSGERKSIKTKRNINSFVSYFSRKGFDIRVFSKKIVKGEIL